MARRVVTNRTNIPRISGVPNHQPIIFFVCVRCSAHNFLNAKKILFTTAEAYETQSWKCYSCGFIHAKDSPLPSKNANGKKLPFSSWGRDVTMAGSIAANRFWKSFFTIATERAEVYWKQCNTCGRKIPASAFSGHVGWGPLEKQMECRSCKAVINTKLNPKRTKEQLHESAARRRVAELLLKGESTPINFNDLFERFNGKCFKTGKHLNIKDRNSWSIDHTLPSRWLYPLNEHNATLLSRAANDNKSDKWPSEFYTNNELKRLAAILGADLNLLASKKPIINSKIDVDACVTRMLTVRGATDISKRINELKKLLESYGLVKKLSSHNKRILGYI